MSRTMLTTLLLAACLTGAHSLAEDCYTAIVAGPIQLPDDSRHEAGSLRICRDHLTPVTGLHRAYVDGMPIGIFRSRVRPIEASREEGIEPTVVFVRGAEGRLVLIAAMLPAETGLQLYEMHLPTRVESYTSGVVRVALTTRPRSSDRAAET